MWFRVQRKCTVKTRKPDKTIFLTVKVVQFWEAIRILDYIQVLLFMTYYSDNLKSGLVGISNG